MRSRTLAALCAVSFSLVATQVQAQEIFGAKLTHQLTPPQFCTIKKGVMCSWVMREAQGQPGRLKAPRDGRIAKIRLVACAPRGSFVLQIVRTKNTPESARAVSTGPVINYNGTKRNCRASRNFDIEEFNVDVPVKRGDQLAVIATEVRFMYSSSSGPSIMYDPPLAEGDGFRTTELASGFLMLQAEMAPP